MMHRSHSNVWLYVTMNMFYFCKTIMSKTAYTYWCLQLPDHTSKYTMYKGLINKIHS